jgi:PhzF family phenazine biosynthesis protein
MEIPLYIVDAFASKLFSGNPAAVCPLEAWLDDELMQSIAAENNLSETAFLVPVKESKNAWELRWFTPSVEVDLCGHATLASAVVLAMTNSASDNSDPVFTFFTKSGELQVSKRGDWYYLDFPTRPLEKIEEPEVIAKQIEAACNIKPVNVILSPPNCLAEFESEEQILNLKPDIAKVKGMEFHGLIATAPGDNSDFVSRFFAPRVGINEDPVTGSIHCSLIPYWHRITGKKEMLAYQISARGGELRCSLQDKRVEIGGQGVLFSRGEICL